MTNKFKSALHESVVTIGPVVLIVLILSLFIKIEFSFLLSFIISSVLLIIGTTLFTFGSEYSTVIIGNKIGKDLVKSKRISIILLISFIIGTIITIAEPDLLVFANQITSLSPTILIITISIGVGLCLLLGAARSIFGLDLNKILIFSFLLIFLLSFMVPIDFIPIAFDSGGVTTGTLSIPFILTLGMGLVSSRIDKKAKEDSFGLITLASTGPIIMVLLLGLVFSPKNEMSFDNSIYTSFDFFNYVSAYASSFKEVLIAILPIVVVFLIYNKMTKNINKTEFHKIIFGFSITILGLTIFLVAANVGFLHMGYYIGEYFAMSSHKYLLIPIIMILSFFIAIAEPAVMILIEQVEEYTEGSISKNILKIALSIGVSIAAGLSILRIFTGTPFIYYALIGYGIALILTFFIPKVFTAIAFDAGGATGGSLTTAFLLPIAIGICYSLGENVFTSAFGLASMVSLVPIIAVEIVGLIYSIRTKYANKFQYLDDSIIDYSWEV